MAKTKTGVQRMNLKLRLWARSDQKKLAKLLDQGWTIVTQTETGIWTKKTYLMLERRPAA